MQAQASTVSTASVATVWDQAQCALSVRGLLLGNKLHIPGHCMAKQKNVNKQTQEKTS